MLPSINKLYVINDVLFTINRACSPCRIFFFFSVCNSSPFPCNIKCECYFCAGKFTSNMIKKMYLFASYRLVLVYSCLMSNSINREICQTCYISEAPVCFCCSMIDDIIFGIHFVSFYLYFFFFLLKYIILSMKEQPCKHFD